MRSDALAVKIKNRGSLTRRREMNVIPKGETMTITDLSDCLDRMRKVYPFKMEYTTIDFPPRLASEVRDAVEIFTRDEETGVEIRLTALRRGHEDTT